MSNDVISMDCLGKIGRFGNQLVQYMFLRTYAERHGLTPQAPPWVGNYLFGTSDQPIEKPLPVFKDPYDKDVERMIIPALSEPVRNVDVRGYFQYHSSYYAPDRQFIRSLFAPVDAVRDRLEPARERLSSSGKTVVALHIRRGDYGKGCFYLAPNEWYLQWLDHHWKALDNPVLFIATDDPEIVLPAFKDYQPITARKLGAKLRKAPFYPDFYLMTKADYLVIPNSTFSFVAAMLNQRLTALYRSKLKEPLDDPPFEKTDPWNDVILDIAADVDQFPQIAGIKRLYKHRPRWKRKLYRMVQKLVPFRAA